MKILVMVLFWGNTTYAQKYSKVVDDSTIINFIDYLLKNDTSTIIKNIDNDIIKLNIFNFIKLDSINSKNFSPDENIFKKESSLKNIFTKEDIAWFGKQIKFQKTTKWNLKIKKIKFLNEAELDENKRLNVILYGFSLPIFSSNQKYVIIIKSYYGGFMWGGGSYNLYERIKEKSWRKIKEFNQWGE